MRKVVTVNNIKCGGCENTVKNSLSKIAGIENIRVDSSTGEVEFDYPSEETYEKAIQKLNSLGYTEADPNLIDTAKSYVSCMIGKMN